MHSWYAFVTLVLRDAVCGLVLMRDHCMNVSMHECVLSVYVIIVLYCIVFHCMYVCIYIYMYENAYIYAMYVCNVCLSVFHYITADIHKSFYTCMHTY